MRNKKAWKRKGLFGFGTVKKTPQRKKKKNWYTGEYYHPEDYTFQDDYAFDAPIDPNKRDAWGKKGMDEYKKTGVWRGYSYYVPPSLDYRYIEKMANLFSAKYAVNVKLGKKISIDIENKTLYYNPTALMFGTKANLIATLLHEIGHLRHTTISRLLTGKYMTKYPNSAFQIVNIFEDFRIDEIMAKSYPSANEAYEANMEIVRQMALSWKTKKDMETDNMIAHLGQRLLSNDDDTKQLLKIVFRIKSGDIDMSHDELETFTRKIEENIKNNVKKNIDDTFFDYCSAIILTGYGEKPKTMTETLSSRISKTEIAVEKCINAKSTQEVVDILDKDVFSVIEDLMKENEKHEMKKAAMERAFDETIGKTLEGKYSKKEKDAIKKALGKVMEAGRTTATGKEMKARKSIGDGENGDNGGHTNIPSNWTTGEYAPLKESVQSGIDELVRLLTFLRRKERAVKWQANKKRGKINTRSLYKHKTGGSRLFKKMEETTDTIKSYAFSFVIDTSGSMEGERIIHTARALVLLSEVMEKMNIPYEILNFTTDTGKMTIKSFDDKLSKKKSEIASIVKELSGGTNIHDYFAHGIKSLEAREEKNKIAVILSDGGIMVAPVADLFPKGNMPDSSTYNEIIRAILRNKKEGGGISSVTIEICGDGGDDGFKDVGDRGADIEEAQELPDIFANLLKELILGKRK